jgi:hypothetical protein
MSESPTRVEIWSYLKLLAAEAWRQVKAHPAWSGGTLISVPLISWGVASGLRKQGAEPADTIGVAVGIGLGLLLALWSLLKAVVVLHSLQAAETAKLDELIMTIGARRSEAELTIADYRRRGLKLLELARGSDYVGFDKKFREWLHDGRRHMGDWAGDEALAEFEGLADSAALTYKCEGAPGTRFYHEHRVEELQMVLSELDSRMRHAIERGTGKLP